MSDKFEELKKAITEDMIKAYGEIAYDHAMNPRNLGKIENPEGDARITGPCGDTIEFTMRIKNKIIEKIKFWTDGCGCAIAAASMTASLAKGKTIIEAMEIDQQKVLKAFGGHLGDEDHCALLAANTLNQAIHNYKVRKERLD